MIGIVISILILILVSNGIRSGIFNTPTLRPIYNYGILSRLLGTLGYFCYAFFLSDGSVDAFIYYRWASRFTLYFQEFDFSPLTDESMYRDGNLFYTNFVTYPASLFQIITFDSVFGIYLLFSVVCFVGLVLMLKAFLRNYPYLDVKKTSLYVLLFPAVWFWTSTIGKDAFMFLGFGVMSIAFRPREKINYIYLLAGLAIIYAFRPPVAYMAILSIGALFVLNVRDSLGVRLVKIGAGITMVLFIINFLGQQWGVESLDTDTISEFQKTTQRNNDYGAGALEEKSGGFSSIPRGVIDVLARPFLWEVRNFATLLSSLEITVLLILLLSHRASVARFFRTALTKKLSMFILSFMTIYVVSAGMVMNNIGLIARHRAILFPFFVLMAFSYKRNYSILPRNRKPVHRHRQVQNGV